MAETSYFCFDGTEMSNACRTIAYMNEGLKPHTMSVQNCCCTGLDQILRDEPYRNPALDTAPWVDPDDPDSFEFGGVLVISIEGADFAPSQRSVTNRIGDGAIIGRRRRGARELKFTALVTGSSCCGISYGMQWLSRVLSGEDACAPGRGCSGGDLTYLSCCPEVCSDECPDLCTTGVDCETQAFRTLKDVALVSGPTVVQEIGGACSCCEDQCPAKLVEFTMVAGRPHALRAPVVVGDCLHFPPFVPDPDCIVWSTDPDCEDTDECASTVDSSCVTDPLCTTTTVPTLPVPESACQCEPLERNEFCIPIPATSVPLWSDMVPLVKIYSGTSALRGVRIRFIGNPLGLPADQVDQCGNCAELNLSYLGAGATFELDSTMRRATVTCPGSEPVSAGSVLSGANGLPFTWPTLDCQLEYLVCISADANTITPSTCVSLSTVIRDA